MDQYEETANQSSESRLPQLMLNYEQKSMQNDSFLKVNGDHKVPQHIFPSDDESSGASSHSSSSSPRNLVIDHPDETSKDGIEDKGHKEDEPQVSQPGNQLPHSSSAPPSNVNEKKSTMKRKLSLRDTTNPSLPKKRRHSAKPMDMVATERSGGMSASGNGLPKEENVNRNMELISKPIKKRTGPFREYASYLGLKPTSIPIKCFKCSNANFENLSQLRDHQKICLFKDKQRNSSNMSDTKNNTNITKHLENLNDGLQNSNSVEMLNSSLGPKQKPTTGLPLNNTTARAKKRVFLCSACGTYYENWNLFLHMREVHKRHICLYCIGMFPSAERLTFHLEMKHDLEQNHFDSQEKLLRSSRDSCYLMCCVCEHLFTEHEDFSDHKCADHQQPCALCGQKGRHLANCKAGSQSNKSKHKDHYAKRKSKASDKSIGLPHPPDFTLDKTSNAFINGGDNHTPETSILRKIITDRDRVAKRSEDILPVVKTNGCAEMPAFRNVENGGPSYEMHQPLHPAAHGVHNEHQSFENSQFKNVGSMENLHPALPIENLEPPLPPPDENTARREEQSKTQESFDSSMSQSNTTSELTSHTNSSPEKEANESLNRSDISQAQQEASVEPKPLFVPKFKIKIPKEFQTPIESEQSSTESDDNDVDRSDNGDEEQSEASDMDIEEDNAEVSAENAKSDTKEEQEETGGDDGKANEEIASLDDKKILKPEDTLPDQVFSPEKSPLKIEANESKEELSMEEPMQISDLKNESDPVEEGSPSNKINEADEDIPLQDLLLQQPLDKIDMIEFMRICLKVTFRICLYCNHARRIAVNGQSFALHLISNHRFSATVDSITAEELKPTTIVQKLKSYLPELENVFFNLETFGGNDKENLKPYEKLFECFQCRFETRIHKELYLHNRKMHLKPAILCFMCRSNFFSYSEILCHMCPGVPNKCVIFDIKFRCCLCDLDSIPSAFRLMVHLRKKHFACDVCLEDCYDQSRLSSHVWKHKLHHLCYRCGIAYRNKPDITKHLFWKHGTESVLCKRCLQKRWPHVYHFCIPPVSFVCEVCNISFSRAMALKVHKRLHTGDAPYPCPEDGCDQKFISRKLLLKHTARHNEPIPVLVEAKKEEIKEEEEEAEKVPEAAAPIEELKVEKDEIAAKDETVPEVETKDEEDQDQLKKKKKRSKKNRENLDDLMDLPAPNLSESDSSEESDSEKSKPEKVVTPVPQVMLSPPSDTEEKEEPTTIAGTQIMDIWENFKSFQASQQAQTSQEDSDDNDDPPPPPILHVTQSDHDYCMMFKPISKLTKSMSVDDLKEIKPEKTEMKSEHSSPKKKQKSPRKGQRSGSESSSSGSSSSSDSSCSCGPNCSCGSSSGSSSDSSSSSDSESSSSEGRRRAAAKRAAKLESKNKSKEEEKKPEETKVQSPKLDTSDFVDVVSTDTKSQEIVDPDSIILESDLETEESDTDEDFYDEHPQKMANQVLTEKRKQLLMQTSLSPSHNFDIVENSRPSTPSIPEEMVKEKKVKLKKRKREKKVSKTENNEPAFKHDIPSPPRSSIPMEQVTALDDSTSIHMPPAITSSSPVPLEHDKSFDEESLSQPLPSGSVNMMMPAPITPRDRLSTGSSSDPDGNLKRSKRRRRPNKFYGYSSDDDGLPPGMVMSGPAAFKPTPPPNLTWRKEDLPAPSTKSSHHRSHKSSAATSKKTNSVQPITPSLPPIPPIIIRPSALLSKKPLSVENAAYKPPIVQPIRVPPVPVHHIRPPQYVSPTRSFDDSDSSSDDDHRLTIMTPVARKTTKTPRARQQRAKNQQQKHESQQSQSQQKQSQANPVQQLSQGLYQQQQSHIEPATPVKQPKPIPPALLPNPDAARIEYFKRNNIRWPIQPPAGARPPREGESVYCYCRCPYDEVSEMIACDGDDCMIEWFHFECVGILVPPQGKWFCPECRPLYPNEAGSSMEVT